MCLKINIAKIRYDKNISVRKLSLLSGVSKTTINDIENGRRYPNIKHLHDIAKALDMHIDDLYDSPYK